MKVIRVRVHGSTRGARDIRAGVHDSRTRVRGYAGTQHIYKSIGLAYTTLGESGVVYEHVYRSGVMGIRGDSFIHIHPRP